MTAALISSRRVEPADQEFLYRVYASTREEELAMAPWPAEQKEAFLRQQFAAQDQHYRQVFPDAEFSVLVADATAIGRFYVWRGPAEIRVIDLALLAAWRGQGIGGELLARLLAEARAGGKGVTIHVEENNRAQRLYERLGFRRVQQNGIYWLMEWTVES